MSKESLEHLSSLMDGEISRESGMFLTRRLSSDDALCETWERYHLIRDCIRQPGSKLVVSGLSEKLNAKLSAEEAPAVSVWRSRQWIKPVSGLAIAASVALMAIVVTAPQQGTPPGSPADPALAQPANEPFVSPNNLPLAPVSQPVSYSSGGQSGNARLNAYLLRHNQMARTAGRQGFVSFVPIVAAQASSEVETDGDKPESTTTTGNGQEATENK
jgi:sigma-E factor negative regulatory protein RseA